MSALDDEFDLDEKGRNKFDGIASRSIEFFWFLTISIVEVKNVHFKSLLNLFKMIKYKFDSICVQETAEEMYKL